MASTEIYRSARVEEMGHLSSRKSNNGPTYLHLAGSSAIESLICAVRPRRYCCELIRLRFAGLEDPAGTVLPSLCVEIID